jgi:hypothetical protein
VIPLKRGPRQAGGDIRSCLLLSSPVHSIQLQLSDIVEIIGVSRNNSVRSVQRLRFCQCSQERQLTGIRVVSVAPAEIRATRLQRCGNDAGSAMFMATGREAPTEWPGDLGDSVV